MMMPTAPSANLVVGKTGFALAALNALLDPVFRLLGRTLSDRRCLRSGVRYEWGIGGGRVIDWVRKRTRMSEFGHACFV